jgi:hypothetical protein
MSPESPRSLRTYVLAGSHIRSAIAALSSRRIHPFFIAYLHLRSLAVEQGSLSNIRPSWNAIGPLLAVPGGPPGKPYYRPFSDREVHDPSRYWLNRNLAGSYAPSSVRGVVLRVVETSNQSYTLRDGHASLALENFLYDSRIPTEHLVGYLYRNFGFESFESDLPSMADVVNIFLEDFHFIQNGAMSADYRVLFDPYEPEDGGELWLEEFSDKSPSSEQAQLSRVIE